MCVSVSELWSAGKMWIGLSHVCLCVRALVHRQDMELCHVRLCVRALVHRHDVDRAISCVSLCQSSGPQARCGSGYFMCVSASEIWSAGDFRNPPVPAIRTICVSLYRCTLVLGPEMTASFIKRGGQHFFSYGCNFSDHCSCCGSLKWIFCAGSQPA